MKQLYKRCLVLVVLLILGFSHGVVSSSERIAEPAATQTPAEPLAERYQYDISFLWFSRIASGELSLQPAGEAGLWRAQLGAQTRGVAAWLTSERVQQYASLMALDKAGRLTALRHDSKTVKTEEGRQRIRLKSYLFDHEGRRVVQKVNRYGREKEEIQPMPDDTPSDALTAFFNVRRGVYGPLKAGNQYRIPAYSRKGPTEIIVDVLAARQRPRRPKFPDQGLLLAVQVDQEVFDTNDGIVYVWLDELGRPAQVVVENVIGLGDVRCTLREKEER